MGEYPSHKVFKHGAPRPIAPNVWIVTGSLPFPLPRNMTIYRLPSGELLLYSVIAMDEAGMQALEALGRPAVMVVPQPFHIMDAPFYARRYPGIRVVAAEDSKARLAGRAPDVKVHATPEEALPGIPGVRHHRASGTKFQEIWLDLETSEGRTIALCDLIGRGSPDAPFLFRLLGPPGGGLGTPRIVRFRQVTDRSVARGFIEKIAGLSDIRAISIAHGEPVLADCGHALRGAAQRL